ncbi:hypothetical protein [Nocardioides sp.]|uniref:hypothetical protein n=1 Tax=Nocardioides sp. TaxID=35761 RepID=UPI002ED03F3E
MPGDRSTAGVRAAEVIAALSLATDLERVRSELEAAFAPYRVADGGFHLDGLARCVVAS